MSATTSSPRRAAPAAADDAGSRPRPPIGRWALRYALQLFTVVGFVVVAFAEPNFRQSSNLQNIALQSSFAGLSACGMTLLITAGMIDLSVAGIIALTATTLAELVGQVPLVVAVIAALGMGVGLGLVNGLLVTKLRFPPFIATYAMLNVYLAAAFIWTDAKTLPVHDETFLDLPAVQLAGVPALFWALLVVAVACFLLLTRTRFGRNLRAIGGSEAASRMAGLPVDRTRILAFVLFGLLTSASGVGLAALLSSASADMSVGFELNVVAVAVVGGTSLLGGNGTFLGTVTGAVLFAGLNSALNLFGVASYWQYVATGIVLAAALVVASRREAVTRS